MAVNRIDDINSIQIDALAEIGTIGSGNAVTALSNLLGKEITIAVPKVRIMNFNDAVEFIGGPENIVVGLLVRLGGDIQGMMMFVLQAGFAKNIVHSLFGKQLDDIYDADEMDFSAISEIGNILSASYVNALSTLTGLSIEISVPSVCIDMAGAILSVPAIEFARIGNKVMFIDDTFSIDGGTLKSNMILVPEMDSLNLLFSRLGVGG